jgi:NAD(P)-dependent dehydrogenase (short-subunit alcohol dehydrogenase family)
VLQAGVADADQMRAVVAQAVARFGAIHGAFHTAGVPGVGMMQLKTAQTAAAVLAPKIQGTLALAAALRGQPLDFLVLFSSITSVTSGGPGQIDYCAANAFLDAYARKHQRANGLTISIGWGEWLWDAWSEGLAGFPEEIQAKFITMRRAYGIRFDEGMDIIRRALSRGYPHVFVTPQDLQPMVDGSKGSSMAAAREQFWEERQARPLYPRPVLGTTYAAPRNETEITIASIWGDILGIQEIGIEDNFFDLGGNSLLGIDLIARMRKALKLDKLPAYILYEAPTVAAMAEYIQQSQQASPAAEAPEETVTTEKRQDRLNYFKRKTQVEDLT